MEYEQAHRIARERGVSPRLFAVVRAIVLPFFRYWYSVRAIGSDHIPVSGPAIIAANHKSGGDGFVLALAAHPRHLRFMATAGIFKGPLGRLLLRLGAFPVRRGASDQEALQTARHILRNGGVVCIFPGGTRVTDPEEVGTPRRGAARLALETGAPMVPAAISGTERMLIGPLPRPVRLQVAFGAPVPVDTADPSRDAAQALIEDAVWPEVERQYEGLRKGPVVAAAGGAAALGIGVALLTRRRRRR
jgi:1-acyl-sn-glycerol-3-phosphate acyltransferase